MSMMNAISARMPVRLQLRGFDKWDQLSNEEIFTTELRMRDSQMEEGRDEHHQQVRDQGKDEGDNGKDECDDMDNETSRKTVLDLGAFVRGRRVVDRWSQKHIISATSLVAKLVVAAVDRLGAVAVGAELDGLDLAVDIRALREVDNSVLVVGARLEVVSVHETQV